MDPRVKKFFIAITLAVALVIIILIVEIQRTRSITITAQNTTIIADQAIDIPLYPTDPTFGKPGADLQIVEFIDMANPASRAFHELLYRFTKANPDKVTLTWKDLPQKHLFSGDSTNAHIAAACANKQGKFWPFVDQTFTTKNNLSDKDLLNIAQNVGINISQWQTCLTSNGTRQIVINNATLAPTLGIGAAPAVFLNNKRLDTSKDIDYQQLLDSLIAP